MARLDHLLVRYLAERPFSALQTTGVCGALRYFVQSHSAQIKGMAVFVQAGYGTVPKQGNEVHFVSSLRQMILQAAICHTPAAARLPGNLLWTSFSAIENKLQKMN